MTSTSAAQLSALLRRCAAAQEFWAGARLHALALVGGLLPRATLEAYLVLLYCRCGALSRARQVFDRMSSPSMHAFNVLIAASPPGSAFELLAGLLAAGLRPDRYTVPAALRMCAELPDAAVGRALHGFTTRLGLFPNVVVSSALLDMYAKAGLLVDAVKVFDEMPERDVVVWNCLVTGYARAGKSAEPWRVSVGLKSKPWTWLEICGLCCAKEGELMKGREVHGRMVRCLAFDSDVAVGNVLVNMYVKCGCLDAAQAVFAGMCERNVVSWSTLISCYGVHGRGEEALMIYMEMVSKGVKPNCITFTSILSSCSHSGLVTDGRKIFKSMHEVHGVEPTVDHYTCMVDLSGQAGAIEEAVRFIWKIPMKPSTSVWGVLLSACAMHNNVDVAEIAAYTLFDLEESNASNYFTLCVIYGAVGRSDAVVGLRSRMRELGMVKTPDCSWVHVKGCILSREHTTLFDETNYLGFRSIT
jgi:pentatricopeptide repeat protein